MLAERPIADIGFIDLLLEWIDYPLLLAEDEIVFAANYAATEVCEQSSEALQGLPLDSAIDLLHRGGSEAEVQIHRLTIEGRSYQAAIRRTSQSLSAVDSTCRAALRNGFEAYWIATAEGNIVDCSEGYAELTGYPAKTLRTMKIADVDAGLAGREIVARFAAVQRTGFDQFVIRQNCPGNPSRRDLEVKLSVLPRTGGRILGCVRDLTPLRRSESELARNRRAMQIVQQCTAIAQSANDRPQLLKAFCECIVTQGEYALAWIGVRDPKGGRGIWPEASSGHDVEYLDDIYIDVDDTPLAADPNAPEAVCDVFGSAEYAPWREKAMQYGFASAVSLPVVSAGGVEAALSVYSYQADAFDDAAVGTLAQAAGILGLGLEIQRTRLKQKSIEKDAREWDENFRSAFESSLNGILVYDFDGKVLDANAEFCNRLGYTRQELVGMHLPQLEATAYARLFAERLDAVRNNGFAVFETAHVGRDGALHPVSISCRTYTYGDGQIVLAISRDMVQPVSTTERWLHLALEASRTGLFDWDLSTNKVAFSTEWKTQLGYKEEDISDDFGEWELRVHPDDVDRMIDGLKAYLNQPAAGYESEFRMRHKNGSYRFMLARGAVIYDAQGKPERMLGAHVDITDRRRIQQHLNQAQKLESVGRIADGLAHEFNHLLTIVNGYSDLALSDLYEGDPLKTKVQAIRDAGLRASSLNEKLLGFSQSQPAALGTLNLNTIVADSVDMLRRLIGPGVELGTELSPQIPYISADPRQINLLLANLAMNARDAMPQGGRLTIGIQTLDALPEHVPESDATEGPYVQLTVADTGAGLTEERRLRVFDPYFGPSDQSGPGLSAVFGIVQRHRGTIAVASDAGSGTIFQVYLPATSAATTQDDPQHATSARVGTLLLLEGDAALRGLLTAVLAQAGHRVFGAASAGDALLVAEKQQTLDLFIVAPEIEPEFVDRLRQLHPGLKVVFRSTHLRLSDLVEQVARSLAV